MKLGIYEVTCTLADAHRRRSRPQAERLRAIRPDPIPKMERTSQPEVAVEPARAQRFKTFESLIDTFGEFTLVTDTAVTIAAVWNSQGSAERVYAHNLLGRRLDAVIHPRLLKEIEALARRTAVLGRRDGQEIRVEQFGVPRWFSVSAIPLERLGEEGFAACVQARDVTGSQAAAEAVAEREALLVRAEELANFGSWEIDLKTRQITLSPQLMKMLEVSSLKDWSADLYWERMHPADRVRVRRLVDQSVANGKPIEFTARYRGPSGHLRVHMAHTLPLSNKYGQIDRAIGLIQDVTDHRRSRQQLRRLSQQLMSEQDTQRRHLARELHESAGQSLAALKMTLGRLVQHLPKDAGLAASLVNSAMLLADGAVREVRTVSYLLHPPMLDDSGLGPALRWYAKGFSERSGIRATVQIADPFERYSQEIETTVFRIVQEALTNVHRYSGSSTAEIVVVPESSRLQVEVRDHGCGFPSSPADRRRRPALGVGISGMRERVRQLNGMFELESSPGAGTTVRVLLPAKPLATFLRSERTP